RGVEAMGEIHCARGGKRPDSLRLLQQRYQRSRPGKRQDAHGHARRARGSAECARTSALRMETRRGTKFRACTPGGQAVTVPALPRNAAVQPFKRASLTGKTT